MNGFASPSDSPEIQRNSAPGTDPRLQPTPDYGSLGPGSDFQNSGVNDGPISRNPRPKRVLLGPFLALSIGIVSALLAGNINSAVHAGRSRFINVFPSRGDLSASTPVSAQDALQFDRLGPQRQAESLLELAVAHSDGAVDQISSRLDRWQGKLQWDSQMATLTTAALNSDDLRVRQSGIEVELAAYGLAKNADSFHYVMKTAESSDHSQKIWALWALGLMGNRGVGTDRAIHLLSTHLDDADEDSRRWAVEGLALTGAPETIPVLLTVMHNDGSPTVRERAACAIASAGLFTPQQRRSAIPQLLQYTDDRALDAQTHAWAFQALADITGQHLPNDSAAWRSWYASQATANRSQ